MNKIKTNAPRENRVKDVNRQFPKGNQRDQYEIWERKIKKATGPGRVVQRAGALL